MIIKDILHYILQRNFSMIQFQGVHSTSETQHDVISHSGMVLILLLNRITGFIFLSCCNLLFWILLTEIKKQLFSEYGCLDMGAI